MFTTILLLTFVSAFIAIVAFGHVLLVAAIWPERPRNRDQGIALAADSGPGLPQPK